MNDWIKILSTGTFNGITHTLEDLNAFVSSFEKTKYNFLPDLKISHEDTKEERDLLHPILKTLPFSFGKISEMKVEKNSLYVKASNVHQSLKYFIDNKFFTTHSIEFKNNVKVKKEPFKRWLMALAILPAGEPPALLEKFKPYMYNLETEIGSEQINFSDLEIEFEDEQKHIYFIQESKNMSKEALALLNKKPAEGQTAEQEAAEGETAGEHNATEEAAEAKKPEKKVMSMEEMQKCILDTTKELSSLRKERDDLKKYSLGSGSGVLNVLKNDVEELKKENEALKLERTKKEATEFIFKYSRSEDPKIPVALEDAAIFLLSNAPASNNDEVQKYSLSDKKLSFKETFEHFISSLPAVKTGIGKEKIKTKNGEELPENVVNKYSGDFNLDGIAIIEKIEKYALSNNITKKAAFDIYYNDSSKITGV